MIVNHIIIVAKRMIASKYALSTGILFDRLKRDMQLERFQQSPTGRRPGQVTPRARSAVARQHVCFPRPVSGRAVQLCRDQ